MNDISAITKVHATICKLNTQSDFFSGLAASSFKERWKIWLADKNRVTLVAEKNKEIIGFVAFTIFKNNNQEDNPAEIHFLYVNGKKKLKKIKQKIFEDAILVMRQKGIKKICLWLLKENYEEINIFQSMGGCFSQERINDISGFKYHELCLEFDI